MELVPFGYFAAEVNLRSNPIDLSLFSENNVWILKSTSAVSSTFGGEIPYVKLTLTLERRYAFFILNLFSPVLILALLNAMVFILPADSGERIGYSITCVLSLSVYMAFATEVLPTSSKPIAIVIYVLLFYTLISTMICVGTIVGLWLHLHDDATSPPRLLIRMCCASPGFCRRKGIVDVKPSDSDTLDNGKSEDESEVTWKDIAKKFDKFCFVLSMVCILLLSILYLVIVRIGK